MASATDKFTKVGLPGSATTLASPGYTVGASSLNLTGSTNWPTTSGVYFDIYLTQTVGNATVEVPGSRTTKKGLLSGTSISGLQHIYGTDQDYPAGSNTKVVITVSAPRENSMVDGLLVQHNLDGTHSAITATTLNSTGLITGQNGLTISSGTVTLPNNSVTGTMLATSALKLGKAQRTSSIASAATSATQVTDLSVTATVPAGGRSVKVTFYSQQVTQTSPSNIITFSLWNGTVGSGTKLQEANAQAYGAQNGGPVTMIFEHTPAPGSITYNLGWSVNAGTATLNASATSPSFLLVELI